MVPVKNNQSNIWALEIVSLFVQGLIVKPNNRWDLHDVRFHATEQRKMDLVGCKELAKSGRRRHISFNVCWNLNQTDEFLLRGWKKLYNRSSFIIDDPALVFEQNKWLYTSSDFNNRCSER